MYNISNCQSNGIECTPLTFFGDGGGDIQNPIIGLKLKISDTPNGYNNVCITQTKYKINYNLENEY